MSSLLRGHYTNDRVSFDHCIIEWTGLSANCLGEVKLINCAFMSNRIEQSILAGNCSGRVFLENNILIGPAPLILSDYSASRHPELYHIQNNIFMERDVQIPIPLNNREVKLDLGDLRTSAYHIAPNGPASEERYGVWEEPIPLSSILPPEIPEDINGDGTFSPGDAMCLLQKYLGKPCSE